MPRLPDSWVDALLGKLKVRYGAAFGRQYVDLDPMAVRADWAEVLGVFANRPNAIGYGLGLLPPDKPPNALQFKALCMPALDESRQDPPPALPAPKADKARVDALVATVQRGVVRDPKAWARALKAREEYERVDPPSAGHRMTQYQREAWREALGEREGAAS